ncbi:MAG: hypothetical protein LUD15_08680 [Bacteroides sp.]|nr:hypothetical protein [Bacteroides sp.]
MDFFPEGGKLLEWVIQKVAFKAQARSGGAKEIKGKIYTSKGDTITHFESQHDGRGIVNIYPETGIIYHADILSEQGERKIFDLPKVENQGFAITLNRRNRIIYYETQKTKWTQWPDSIFLIAHTRGGLRMVKKITNSQIMGGVEEGFLEEGITHFLLIDHRGIPLSERLCFVMH